MTWTPGAGSDKSIWRSLALPIAARQHRCLRGKRLLAREGGAPLGFSKWRLMVAFRFGSVCWDGPRGFPENFQAPERRF